MDEADLDMTVRLTQKDTFHTISQRLICPLSVCPQMLLDEEEEEMDSTRRAVEHRNTDSFDYSRYHTIEEARNPAFKL